MVQRSDIADGKMLVLKEHALPGPATCPVVIAQFGVDAAIVGAASLGVSRTIDAVLAR